MGLRLRVASSICGAWIALAVPALGLDPHAPVAQYGFQSWQTDTGLPQNTVHAIVQGPNGFLWIATEGGLVRFDGEQFSVIARANTSQLPSDLIDDLMLDSGGTVWVSTSGGLARVVDGRVERFGSKQGIPSTQVWRTFEGAGAVWVMTAAGLYRVEGIQAERVRLNGDLTENSRMLAAPDGSLWLGTAEGVMRSPSGGTFAVVGASGEVVALARDGEGAVWAALRAGVGSMLERCSAQECAPVPIPGGAAVNALATDRSGHIWVGTDAGLFAVEGDKLQAVGKAGRVTFLFCDREGMLWAGTAQGLMRATGAGEPELLRSGDIYLAAAEDREGDLWLGTEAGGLAVLRDRKFSTLTAQQGLSNEYVLALAQNATGDVFAGTRGGGLYAWHAGAFRPAAAAQKLASTVVLAVATSKNGDVWVGTPDGLSLIRNGQLRTFTTADGLADDFVRSLYVGHDGALWIGTRHGVSRYAEGKFTSWSALDGLGSDLVGAMTEDRDGTLWIGTLGGLSRFSDGKFTNFTVKDGLSSNVVTSLHVDGDGTLWVGTNDAGLSRVHDGKIAAVRLASLPSRVIGILEDGAGYLWISSNSGVYRVKRNALNQFLSGGSAPEVMRFGVADGMRISECSSGGHPAALALQDGELWFATLKGIARVNPAQMPVNRVAPRVAIEGVVVDDVAQDTTTALKIAPGHSHYEFDYAGLSFVAPQKVEYRYQLEGFDRGWVEAGTRRVAYYTNLPHGRYTFRVMARNNDGVWSETAATAQLTVQPHVWQTLWFRLLLALALVGLGYAAWRRRLRGVERQYEAVLAERTRIAREIHDTLAQGFVAVSVQLELVARLMQTSVAAAKAQLDATRALVRSSIEDARLSIWELRSQTTEQEDLASRLLKMAEEVIARAGVQVKAQIQVSGTYHPLDGEVEREVLRIGREAVVNAVRHASPKNILLRLKYQEDRFEMEVRDDGRGFAGQPADGTTGHYGITGMRERAHAIDGELVVDSWEGEGTSVKLDLELAREAGKKR
ncbi:MAG TPA: two-component regulator propeller domain-containing protein [Acidobacteriaceae bacterium]|nr:two-component regulator propeller domain-containing protein [Acidobacteriaceae bacterium]